jgi:DNA-binding NarL/FixJ family response regulator
MLPEPARILAVDDHEVVLEGLRALFAREEGLVLAAVAKGAKEALRLARESRFDVAIVDLALGAEGGVEVIQRLAAVADPPALVAHAAGDERDAIRAAVDAGVRVIASKSGPREDVVLAVRAALGGGSFASESIARAVAEARAPALDETERTVLAGIARGEGADRIGVRLGVSTRTVESVRARLKARLGARGTADLVRAALAAGLVRE